MKHLIGIFIAVLCLTGTNVFPQAGNKLEQAQREARQLEDQLEVKREEIKGLKLEKLHEDLKLYGYPQSPFGGQVVAHKAMVLEYVEEHEQAAWVYHIILPDIMSGNQGRTNDFRPDTLIATGSAVELDYLIIGKDANGNTTYDGFGFDRGHLAPSADFRWHREALSESYFYSNISPQRAAFNREIWAEVEDAMRNYVYRTERPLWVITGGVLHSALPKVERAINKVSIPETFYKIAYDPEAGQAIAFLVPNQKSFKTPGDYVTTVSEIEKLTGINFFPLMPESQKVEGQVDKQYWLPPVSNRDVQPLQADRLPKNHFNSVQAAFHVNSGKTVTVCGTVVSPHFSKAGNVLLNFDKAYPNQDFIVFIKSEDLKHFSLSPDLEYKNRCICATGKVEKMGTQPAMYVTKESQLSLFTPEP